MEEIPAHFVKLFGRGRFFVEDSFRSFCIFNPENILSIIILIVLIQSFDYFHIKIKESFQGDNFKLIRSTPYSVENVEKNNF